ncbi:MAG TPA: ABC transporter substrate-binding protein [Anaeromyxobacteraceae bacterium]|nr:ABC transporter substrate-binding protein [Anaeromyxobacteraceae bacterium]
MALTGDFKETPFADLLQLYSISRQTVAVTVSTSSSAERPDGVFYFDSGDLVGAFLGGAMGREAVRRALRLRQGRFRVDPATKPPDTAEREQLRHIVLEELVKLDEEQRAEGRAARAASSNGATPANGAPPAPARAPTPPGAMAVPAAIAAARVSPPPVPAAAAVQTSVPPARAGAGAAGPAPNPGRGAPPPPPAAPPPARGTSASPGYGMWIAAGAVAAVLLGVIAWFALAQRSAKEPAAPAAHAAAAPGVRGVGATEIALGMVGSFSGSNKERGRAMRAGWETALAEANAAGGVNGRTLKLLALDDGYDPQRTAPAMKQLVEQQGVFAVVGNVGTATSAVAIPYATEKKLVFFGALSGADLLRKTPPDRYVFNFRASLSQEGAAAVRWLADVRRVPPERIAVLVQQDEFGESGWRGAARELEARGVKSGSILKVGYARNTADVREAIDALKAHTAAVDAVVMVATYKPAATFVRRTRDAGLKLVYACVSADSNGLAEELVESGVRYTQDVTLTQVVPVPTSRATAVMKYRAALERYAPGERPGSTTLEAWIGAQIFLEGLRRAGPDPDPDKLVAALETIRDWDMGVGTVISFGPQDHQGSRKVWGWRLQPDGGWQQIDLE